MNKKIKGFALVMAMTVLFSVCLTGCGGSKTEKSKVGIAYQYGISGAPIIIMKEKKLIEKHYKKDVEINWQVLNSGSAMNEAIIAGDIDVAGMGIPPFVTGKSNGVAYKIYSGLNEQKPGLVTADSSYTSLADFKPDDKIALLSLGSIHHLILAMAAKQELGDAHALDANIMSVSHPDGMQAFTSGAAKAHFTSIPYLNMELEKEGTHEIESAANAFPELTFLIGVATEDLYNNNRELYDAIVAATQEAVEYINNNKAEVAALLCENEGVTQEVMEGYLNDPRCVFTTEAKGISEMAAFMKEEGFIENEVSSAPEELFFDNLLK